MPPFSPLELKADDKVQLLLWSSVWCGRTQEWWYRYRYIETSIPCIWNLASPKTVCLICPSSFNDTAIQTTIHTSVGISILLLFLYPHSWFYFLDVTPTPPLTPPHDTSLIRLTSSHLWGIWHSPLPFQWSLPG